MPPYVHRDLVVPPPECGRSEPTSEAGAQLRFPYVVSDDMYDRGVPGGTLHLNSTDYPDHGRYGDLHLQGKIPTAEPGIEPGTSWLVVRSSDHQATRLVRSKYVQGSDDAVSLTDTISFLLNLFQRLKPALLPSSVVEAPKLVEF
jgi:hypothetical protein